MRLTLVSTASAALLALCGGAQAMGFAEAFDAARRFDAQFRAAGHELDAARQGVPIARSYMLPSASINASTADVSGKRLFTNSLNQEVRVPVDYNSPQASLQIRAPIFNYEGVLRTKIAESQVGGAESTFESRRLELADRMGTSYLQVLLAVEGLVLGRAEVTSLEAQLARARQRLVAGEGTRTDVAQIQAQLELAKVRQVDLVEQVAVARRVMRRVTGIDAPVLNALPADFVPAAGELVSLEEWQSMAEQRSPVLRLRQQAIETARLAVKRNRATHLPRLDLVASVGHSQNESLSSLNQTSSTRSIGVQLSVPLYSGGGIEATVRQSLSDQARAEEEFRAEREALQIEIQRQHAVVHNGRGKVEGHQKAVDAADLTLQGVTRALAAGLSTHADVLEAQARVFSARRDLAVARYEYLAARLRLAVQSGMPVDEAVADIDRRLTVALSLETYKTP